MDGPPLHPQAHCISHTDITMTHRALGVIPRTLSAERRRVGAPYSIHGMIYGGAHERLKKRALIAITLHHNFRFRNNPF
jgi:hypothetical protein